MSYNSLPKFSVNSNESQGRSWESDSVILKFKWNYKHSNIPKKKDMKKQSEEVCPVSYQETCPLNHRTRTRRTETVTSVDDI